MYRIAIDLMGGDFAPKTVIDGILAYLQESQQTHFLLLGEEAVCLPHLACLPKDTYTFYGCEESIGMKEHPVRALKEKDKSSISKGFQLLKSNEAQALISAGNTGAMLVGANYYVKVIEGVSRPVIPAPIPRLEGDNWEGHNLLLDAGLNADCKPDYLNQFALLGSIYASLIYGRKNPRVALLNIGEEEGKGNQLMQAAYPLLKANKQINFIGNVEGRDMSFDKAEVIVCDGYTGNISLKLAESFYTLSQKIGVTHPFLDRFNYEMYGGTPILGIEKSVIIGHGISQGPAFKQMIHIAVKTLTVRFAEHIAREFQTFLNAT